MEMPTFASPTNTVGMGDPVAPTETSIGSGDIISVEKPKKKKMKSLKSYLKKKTK